MALYLIDGNSYVYRAYYAIRGLTDSRGRPTGAVFGFTRILLKLLKEREPDGLAVSFDTPHPTERHELFEDYKAHRPETPDDLVAQLPLVKQVLEAFRIPVFEEPGYEADDVLATLAERAARAGREVFIVTGDKDMLQLVGGPVRVYDPMKDQVIDEAAVRERYGLPPERMTEYMALVGDAVDNIPGVKGVGDKTARGLLEQFPNLEELMAHPERIKRERLRKLITEGTDAIKLSRRLAEINRSVPLTAGIDDLALREPDWDALRDVLRDLQFTSLLGLLPRPAAPEGTYETVLELPRLRDLAAQVKDQLALDTETTGRDPLRDSLVGFSLALAPGQAAYVPLAHAYPDAPDQLGPDEALGAVRKVLEDPQVTKVGHNIKFDLLVLARAGVDVRGPLHDTMVASYLLSPGKAEHSLEVASLEHLGRTKTPYREVAGGDVGFQQVPLERAAPYAAGDADLALALKPVLLERLEAEGLTEVYENVEMPLVPVLAAMEEAGLRVDAARLESLGAELRAEIGALEQRIYFSAGEEFNLNSPKQLARVLFERLRLRPRKKKKTGYSTDVSVLEELAAEHELPREVLQWRSLTKLRNTYVDVLPRLVNPATGRIHTSFNQAVTATGRLSSSEPNLQNIPIRGRWGREIREAFVAEEGHVMLSADYAQIELRILAHLSGDEALAEAFARDVDVHARTAAELFGVPESSVSTDMRRVAKTVNFGVLYGMSPFGLSEALGITRAEAEDYIRRYFAGHPGVSAYVGRMLAQAREEGFVRTIAGRKRPVPELRSRNANTRLQGERLALNSPIQGSAADIIKVAMIRAARGIRDGKLRTRMLLQVHDELVFEVPQNELDEAAALVRESMEGAFDLSVPLVVELGSGRNWAEAH